MDCTAVLAASERASIGALATRRMLISPPPVRNFRFPAFFLASLKQPLVSPTLVHSSTGVGFHRGFPVQRERPRTGLLGCPALRIPALEACPNLFAGGLDLIAKGDEIDARD